VAVGASFFDPVTWNANVELWASARRMERLMESGGVFALGDSRQPPAVPLRKLGDMITVSNVANADAILVATRAVSAGAKLRPQRT
jgi:hypothetical protein